MRNSKWNNLRTGLLAILLAAVFAPALVHTKDCGALPVLSPVGVKAGDWVKYGQVTVTWTGNGTEPSSITDMKKLDWVRIDVLNVSGTTATLNITEHYKNDTQTFQSDHEDVQSGGGMGLLYLVASNLTAGEPLIPQAPKDTINQTVTRMYAGANRNVNMIDIESSYSGYQNEYKVYWDQKTGIMVEQYVNETVSTNPSAYIESSFKATETNLWSANTFDLIQNNRIYIIAGIAVIIVIVAATIVLRRRKPPSSQQPPPSSLPPPTAHVHRQRARFMHEIRLGT